MNTITLVDPKGIKRLVPIEHAQQALQAGAQYASPQDKQMAVQYGQQVSQPKSWWEHALQGLKTAAGEVPQGFKEGIQTGYAGLTGGQFQPTAAPDEFGASLGRGTGELLGQGAMAVPGAIAGGLIGGPPGAIVGAGIGAGATTPGGIPERSIAALETMALPGAGKLLKGAGKQIIKIPAEIKALFSKTNTEKALNTALARHDSLESTASELFNHARDQMKKRGIKEIKPQTDVIDKIKRFLPKTPDHQKLYEDAKGGDPESLHKLQSWLWKKGNKATNSEDHAISNRGEEMLSLRNQLNQGVQNKLAAGGHLDLVHSYKQGQKLFKELKDTYYKNKKIQNVFDPEIRKIPEDVTKHFSENSTPMNEFFKSHPELKEEVLKSKRKREAITNLKKKAGEAGVGAGVIYGGSKLSDLFEGE